MATMLEQVLPADKLSLMAIPYTAFTPDGAEVVVAEVEKQAKKCIAYGNDVCLLQGTTGEWPSLSLQERVSLATEWRRHVPYGHAMKLVLHIGHDALPDAKELASLAHTLRFDGVLLSPPSKFVSANIDLQVACLAEVLQLCPDTPAFYYHYPGVYRDEFDLCELFERARHSCPNLCGCKLSGCTVEMVERYGRYSPSTHAVITTGHTNLLRSLRLPSVRAAIISSWEPPIYRPVLRAHAEGRHDDAQLLEDYIGQSRGPMGELNAELGMSPGVSPTAVYTICANKALANRLEGAVGPCRLPLGTW
jgi:dihydrodipicolinate synthase/N-acetylneuraminate lyase